MKICITGGYGYLGSVLSRTLVEAGYKVVIFDNLMYENKNPIPPDTNFFFIKGDIKEVNKLSEVVKNSDVVIHLAAIVGDPACDAAKKLAVDTNLNGTLNIIRITKKYKKPLIYASTCSVYGASSSKYPLVETSKLLPLSIYSLSKLAGEDAVRNIMKKNYLIFRMGTLFGYSPNMRFDLVVNTFVRDAILKGWVTLFGGEQFRPFLHVLDASNFYLKAIEIGEYIGQTFNIGGFNYKIKDVTREIKKEIKHKVKVYKEMKDPRNYIVDSTKAINFFKVRFKKRVKDGASEIKEKIKEIENPYDMRYDRAEFIRQKADLVNYEK